MALFSGELLRVSRSGAISTSFPAIDDSDANLSSQDLGAIYTLDGVVLALAPVVNFGDIQGTTLNGSLVFCSMTHFNSWGADYYLLDSDTAPQDFATVTVTATSNGGNVGAFAYLNKSMSLDRGALLNGRALVVTFDGSVPTAQQVDTVIVNDDDGRIQFNGQNGQPNSETGAAAQIVLGEGRLVQSFNTGNAGAGDTQMVLVEVTYQSANGTGTFEALRLTQPIFSGSLVYYMPAHRIGRSG